MNIIGIIIETNPFHNGHQYFINEIKRIYNPDLIVAVTSTSFTMRGEVSVLNKFDKTKALLNGGIDVVLEFPFILSTQSSDYFALNAVTILNTFGVNQIVCGCENDNIEFLHQLFEIENSKDFENAFKANLQNYKSYKQTYEQTFKDLKLDTDLIDLFNKPNFTLAYQYFKAIKNHFTNIKFNLIQRTNSYDDESLNSNVVSAKAIRYAVVNNLNYNQYLPFDEKLINLSDAEKLLHNLIKYHCVLDYKYNDNINNEGIINYIINNSSSTNDYNDYISNLANKRYSKSRIKRTILYMLLNIEQLYHKVEYIRLLGVNNNGLKYINSLNKETKNMLFASAKELKDNELCSKILDIELKATKLYSLITNDDTLFIKEYQLPIRKD